MKDLDPVPDPVFSNSDFWSLGTLFLLSTQDFRSTHMRISHRRSCRSPYMLIMSHVSTLVEGVYACLSPLYAALAGVHFGVYLLSQVVIWDESEHLAPPLLVPCTSYIGSNTLVGSALMNSDTGSALICGYFRIQLLRLRYRYRSRIILAQSEPELASAPAPVF